MNLHSVNSFINNNNNITNNASSSNRINVGSDSQFEQVNFNDLGKHFSSASNSKLILL